MFSVASIAREPGVSRPTLHKTMQTAGFGKDARAFYTFILGPPKIADVKHERTITGPSVPIAIALIHTSAPPLHISTYVPPFGGDTQLSS